MSLKTWLWTAIAVGAAATIAIVAGWPSEETEGSPASAVAPKARAASAVSAAFPSLPAPEPSAAPAPVAVAPKPAQGAAERPQATAEPEVVEPPSPSRVDTTSCPGAAAGGLDEPDPEAKAASAQATNKVYELMGMKPPQADAGVPPQKP